MFDIVHMPSETQTITSAEFLWAMRQCCSAPECRRINAARITNRAPRRSLAAESDENNSEYLAIARPDVCAKYTLASFTVTPLQPNTRVLNRTTVLLTKESVHLNANRNSVCSREIYTPELLGKIFHTLFTMNISLCGRRSRANVSRMKTIYSSRSFN